MNQLCRRVAILALGFALVAAPLQSAWAQANKPAVLISLANLDKLLGDIGYLTRAAGTPELGGMVTLMAGQYIEGLNSLEPAGIYVTVNGPRPSGIAFLAVADFEAVVQKIEESVGELEDVGGGVKKLALQRDIFLVESNGWVFVSDSAGNLTDLPEDPDKTLGDLPDRYDIAFQINVQEIPDELRKMAINEMREGFESGLRNSLDGDQPELQEKVGRRGIENLVQFIEGADQLTVGWGVDDDAGTTHIDIEVTAIANSKLAEQLATLENTTTSFVGFDLPGAAASFRFSTLVMEEDIEQAQMALQVMRDQVLKEIDEDDDLPNKNARKAAKEIVTSLLSVFEETIKTGKMDGGATLLLEDETLQFVAGGFVADGAAIEQSLKRLVELAKEADDDDLDFDRVKFNVETHAGIDLHSLVIQIPEDEEEARRALGDEFSVAVGTGPKSFYIAVGGDSMDLLKTVVDGSKQAGETKISPVALRVALLPIMKFASKIEDDAAFLRLTEALERAPERDEISIVAESKPLGATYRIEVQEGVLQLIGQAAKMQNDRR